MTVAALVIGLIGALLSMYGATRPVTYDGSTHKLVAWGAACAAVSVALLALVEVV